MLIRIGVVVGEPSGDRLGAQLAAILKQQHPSIQIEGVIGPEMIKAGCVQLVAMDILSVMGIIDPLKNLHKILKMRKWLLRYFLEDPPDLFIGIDAPDFNLGVERILHDAGIPTVHYVSPSVWAWRQGRIKNIKKSVDLMLTLFPFEEQFYKQHQVPVCFTGHPTADIIPLVTDKALAKQELGYNEDDKVVAILPGSRNSELKHLVKIYLETIKLVHDQKPNLKFVVPLVYYGHQDFVEFWRQKLIPNIELKYVVADSYAVMRAADFAIVTSGTATLEMMLHKTPMLVAFRTNRPTFEIVKRMVKVKFIALPNLIDNSRVVPEYIQQAANPKSLAAGLLELIDSNELQTQQVTKFVQLHKDLQQGASLRAAAAIGELLTIE
jgi:lipid-A-disaccharide synthase